MEICPANTAEHILHSRTLFSEYVDGLGVDLSFQGFAAELATLPGDYSPPRGRLLLALAGNDALGCVALRPIAMGDQVCEMKRLYVRPGFRRHGVGKMLAQRIVDEARTIGYRTMKLDTLSSMGAALRLYGTLGFVRCPAYYDTPLKDTVFMELQL